jgi:ferredoxin-type protein NapH
MDKNESIGLSDSKARGTDLFQQMALALFSIGLLLFVLAGFGFAAGHSKIHLGVSLSLVISGSLLFFYRKYIGKPAGVKNDQLWQNSLTGKGIAAWVLGVFLTGFYIILYWFPDLLENLVRLTDALSYFMRGMASDRWFLYGTVYTLAVSLMGIKAVLKYRHSAYQIVRTLSIIFFQFGFAYLIPALLQLFNEPEFYFSYFWPLKYDYLFPSTVYYLTSHSGALGVFMVFWGAMLTFIATPILTYFFGKRWYCSWVCGCGGLANTAGDPFRQLSDKSLKAWKIERWMIHSVLVLVTITTAALWINSYSEGALFGSSSGWMAKTYGFLIGGVFSGVIGVGFYPIMGSRVWCRFGCPMAAILGIQQRIFSRFRITTNGAQCISCGNCSNICEMGIDVKAYAQQGKNIVRASCVGCGMCSTVCPRGVLNLENGPLKGRIKEGPILLSNEKAKLKF